MTGKKAERRRRNLDRMRAYVATLAPLFRVQHWEIAVDGGLPAHNGEASVWTSNNCHLAVLRFTDKHFADSVEEQRISVAHELIHIVAHDWELASRDTLDGLDPTAKMWATERYERAMERSVDALSRVLAPFLPLPPGESE